MYSASCHLFVPRLGVSPVVLVYPIRGTRLISTVLTTTPVGALLLLTRLVPLTHEPTNLSPQNLTTLAAIPTRLLLVKLTTQRTHLAMQILNQRLRKPNTLRSILTPILKPNPPRTRRMRLETPRIMRTNMPHPLRKPLHKPLTLTTHHIHLHTPHRTNPVKHTNARLHIRSARRRLTPTTPTTLATTHATPPIGRRCCRPLMCSTRLISTNRPAIRGSSFVSMSAGARFVVTTSPPCRPER